MRIHYHHGTVDQYVRTRPHDDTALEPYRASIRAYATVNPMVTARTARVDHGNPIHDGYCRCRICKPPLTGDLSRRFRLAAIGTAGLASWAAITAAVALAR